MKVVKILLILLVAYVGVVVVFESLLGYFQPAGESTLVLATEEDDGSTHERVLSRLESGGQLYVAANHWPRAWYYRALENPAVEVTVDGTTRDYVAEPVTGDEHQRLDDEHRLGPVIRILTGFPPRRFIRLESAAAQGAGSD
ncbi:MAG: nitroreductase/quinone reductase family protein [Pseudomonadota bacterium]